MIITQHIEYEEDGTCFIGYMAYDDTLLQPMPCVIVVHDWGGRGKAACKKAEQLASVGYVGFAIDMYGNAQLGHTEEQRRALMTPLLQNRDLLAKRVIAGLNIGKKQPYINANKIAAIGYCFGGLCVLDLARTGTKIKGVVSFHGLLSEPENTPIPTPTILAKILVLHGQDDPLVLPTQVMQFTTEMTLKKADWQVHTYGLTAHAFTNPEAQDDAHGLRYNKTADHRSWITTLAFLEEVFS